MNSALKYLIVLSSLFLCSNELFAQLDSVEYYLFNRNFDKAYQICNEELAKLQKDGKIESQDYIEVLTLLYYTDYYSGNLDSAIAHSKQTLNLKSKVFGDHKLTRFQVDQATIGVDQITIGSKPCQL